MSNINKQAQAIIADIGLKHGSDDFYAPIIRWDEFKVITGALEAAEKRIAELEAREVVLPQRISMEGGAYCTAHARYDEDGDYYYRDEVIESLVAAGIITKVGE